MTDRFYSVNVGGDKVSVAETATTTAGAQVEVRITYDGTNMTKMGALIALEQLEARIQEDTWPPN